MNTIFNENPYGDDKIFDACGLFGIMDVSGERFSGRDVVRGISLMNERGNGLGSGYAVYGCYPDYADCYAFHVMYTNPDARADVELLLKRDFILVHDEEVPHFPIQGLYNAPLIWRYFLRINEQAADRHLYDEAEFVITKVMAINIAGLGAYIYSSGRDMAAFKGVGLPDQIAAYFGVEHYEGYLWTAHNRFPTNTPGWWGGAHPFGILDWTVVHNGEISSYGANKRFLEMHGYHCTMTTDTEAMAYAADFLMRRHNLPVEVAVKVMAAPLWEEIARMPENEQALYRTLRQVYAKLLFTGPFTVIIARQGEMIGLADRLRLRPLVAATAGERLYISSEESAIRLVSPDLDHVWTPVGGEPVIGRLGVSLCPPNPAIKVRKAAAAVEALA